MSNLNDRLKEFEIMAADIGLTHFPIEFEIVPQDVMLEVVTYALPARARHWVYGQSYDYQKYSDGMGYSKIYEVIMNNDPSYAFMLDSNSDTINTMVMAHCFGHSGFFLNNYLFQSTDRKMVYNAAERAQRITEYVQRYGIDKVEHTMNIAFAIDKHIDWSKGENRTLYGNPKKIIKEVKKKEFDDILNPKKPSKIEIVQNANFPPHPESDLLWFLSSYGDLEDWQKDIFQIIRQESFYFYPQYSTKIGNEGFACITGDSLVNTELGILTMRQLIEDSDAGIVSDGTKIENILAKGNMGKKDCIKITASSGVQITGADNHRILMKDLESWKQLDQLSLGDEVAISAGINMWPTEYYDVSWTIPNRQPTISEICREHGISTNTVTRFINKTHKTKDDNVEKCLSIINDIEKSNNPNFTSKIGHGKKFNVPSKMTEDFASFLGYLVGDGHISRVGRNLGITTGDLEQAENFSRLTKDLFDLDTSIKKDKNKYRCNVYCELLSTYLINKIGLTYGVSAKEKKIPDSVLRSPKSVMSAFLRSYYDCDGCASTNSGVILSTSSDRLAEMTQVVLLNYGVLSRRRKAKDECWQIRVTGKSAVLFGREIGFGLNRKQDSLNKYIKNHKQWHTEKFYDKIIKIEKTSEIVYDISVSNSHKYVANGLINHNSVIHAEFMSKLDSISPEEHLDFCRVHEKVVQPGGNPLNINPYFLGFTILQDIRKRWDNYKAAGESSMSGMEKMLDVVANEDDISLIKNYLTKELVEEMNLFAYKSERDKSGDTILTIKSRNPDDVAESLTKDMHNYRSPVITIEKASSDGMELIHHPHNGKTLDERNLAKVMGYIYELWRSPIDMQTVDDKGEVVHHTYDEDGFSGEE